MDLHYHIDVFWSAQDDCWVADFPDLRSCSAFGDSPEEAVAEARVAFEAWLGAMHGNGLPIPAPRYRPAKAA